MVTNPQFLNHEPASFSGNWPTITTKQPWLKFPSSRAGVLNRTYGVVYSRMQRTKWHSCFEGCCVYQFARVFWWLYISFFWVQLFVQSNLHGSKKGYSYNCILLLSVSFQPENLWLEEDSLFSGLWHFFRCKLSSSFRGNNYWWNRSSELWNPKGRFSSVKNCRNSSINRQLWPP